MNYYNLSLKDYNQESHLKLYETYINKTLNNIKGDISNIFFMNKYIKLEF